MSTIKTVITRCDCYSHGVIVESGDPDEGEIYISTWYHGHQRLSIIDKLKTAWEALHGDVRVDCLILNKESTNQLIFELEKAKLETFTEKKE